jgi:hypothetical protein
MYPKFDVTGNLLFIQYFFFLGSKHSQGNILRFQRMYGGVGSSFSAATVESVTWHAF